MDSKYRETGSGAHVGEVRMNRSYADLRGLCGRRKETTRCEFPNYHSRMRSCQEFLHFDRAGHMDNDHRVVTLDARSHGQAMIS